MPRIALPRRMLLKLAPLVSRSVNWAFRRSAGGQNRPVFWDIDAVEPGLREIDRNFDVIREELDGILPERARIPRYHEADPGQQSISEGDEDWRVFFVYVRGVDLPEENVARCPRTVEIVRKIPRIRRAFFSILDARKSIPAHCGPYHGLLRYHIGMRVPRKNPPKIRVKDQFHTWAERTSMVFDDSWEHQIYNEADEVRVVLIVDVLRPVSWPLRMLDGLWRFYKLLVAGRPSFDDYGLKGRPATR